MPVYTCTIAEGTLTPGVKRELAAEVTRIHSSVNHVPGRYVNVVFHELPADHLFTNAQPSRPVLISGWVRTGHPEEQTSRLVKQIAEAATQITGIPATDVLVVIQNSPAQFAIEGGRVLPEPGHEQEWLAAAVSP